jgi:hypothetical protein
MIKRANAWILSVSVCLVLFAGGVATAADDPPPTNRAADAQGGPLVFEPITGGIIAAPEVKVTSIDHQAKGMLGGYVGYLFDAGFLVAGGIYTEIDWHNHDRNGNWYYTYPDENRRNLTYGGGIVGWTLPGSHPVRPGVRALVGGGWARRDYLTGGPLVMDQGTRAVPDRNYGYYGDWQHFFVVEPQADVAVRLSRHLALDVAGGYRFIADSHGLDHQLRGASGSVSLQIGHF